MNQTPVDIRNYPQEKPAGHHTDSFRHTRTICLYKMLPGEICVLKWCMHKTPSCNSGDMYCCILTHSSYSIGIVYIFTQLKYFCDLQKSDCSIRVSQSFAKFHAKNFCMILAYELYFTMRIKYLIYMRTCVHR